MLNTRASINKAFEGINLGLPISFEDYQTVPPGAGEYPSVAVRIMGDDRQTPRHIGRQTPGSPKGAHRETLTVECEVRTESQTWNQAVHYAGLIRAALDERRITRSTWLIDAETVNPNPAAAGFVRFGPSQLTPLSAEDQPVFKSAFLTWECSVEVPIA